MNYRRLSSACGVVFFLSLANFLAFWFIAFYLGGDAWNGKVEGGAYYLAYHGEFTEVSPAIYRYSQLHILSLIVTMPLGILAAVFAGVFDNKAVK